VRKLLENMQGFQIGKLLERQVTNMTVARQLVALGFLAALLVPDLTVAQAVIVGPLVKKTDPPPTPATFEERNDQSPLNRVFSQPTLALPLASARAVAGPKRVAANEFAVPQYGQLKLQHQVLWRVVPWREKHQEFIEQHASLGERAKNELDKGREQMKLFVWCEKNQLPHCAEFVLRDWLFGRGKVKSSLYLKNVQRLRAHSINNPSPYTLGLPLKGAWHALVDETGHHQKKHWAIFAYDIVIQTDGRLHVGLNVKENHFAWQQPVFAVADGVVISAEGDHNDHPIGRPGPGAFANTIRLDCGGGIYAEYAHLRQDSLLVKKGDRVKRGQMLARVGNSGASGVPHLHFTMSDRDGFSIPGRYRFQVLSTGGWADMTGSNIQEGWNFRPGGN
jgi:hypothetical protein